jgi:hypothetical protein
MVKPKSQFEMELRVYDEGVEQYRRMPMVLWEDFKRVMLQAPLATEGIDSVGPRNELLWNFVGSQEAMYSYLRGTLAIHEIDFSCITVVWKEGKCNEAEMLRRFRRQKVEKKSTGEKPYQPTSRRDKNPVVFSAECDKKRRVTVRKLNAIISAWELGTLNKKRLLKEATRVITQEDSGLYVSDIALTNLLKGTIGFYNVK